MSDERARRAEELSLRGKLTHDAGRVPLPVFARLAEIGTRYAVVSILPWLGSHDPDERQAADSAFRALAARLPAADWLRVVDSARNIRTVRGTSRRGVLRFHVGDVWTIDTRDAALAALREGDADVFTSGLLHLERSRPRASSGWAGLFSAAFDGHVREEAVRVLNDHRDGCELPFLLVRAADWVAPVAALAGEGVSARLIPEAAPELARLLPLIDALMVRDRFSATGLRERIETLLRAHSHLVLANLASPDRALRRASARLACRWSETADAAIEIVLASGEPVERVWAVRRLLEGGPRSEHARLLPAACRDSDKGVRVEALRTCWSAGPSPLAPEVGEVLLDPAEGVRGLAAYVARRWNVVDPVRCYRSALAAGAHVEVALLGLAERGDASDVELARPFRDHASARIRAAALSVIAAHDRGDLHADLLDALLDVPMVAHVAVARLLREGGRIEARELERHASDKRRYVRASAVHLSRLVPRKHRIAFLLPFLLDAEASVRHAAECMHRRTLAQTGSEPPETP